MRKWPMITDHVGPISCMMLVIMSDFTDVVHADGQ